MAPTYTSGVVQTDQAEALAQTRGRLVLVESIYHQQPGDPPSAVESRWSRWLTSQEQPYVRRIQATPAWQKIDSGWVGDDCSLLRLSNEEGKNHQFIPTEEEKERVKGLRLEVGIALVEGASGEGDVLPFLSIDPGLCCRFCPTQASSLRIRCLGGPCRCNVAVYPN